MDEYYRNWMQRNGAIHRLTLAQICLPMTHDTGTYALTDVPCPYDSELFAEIETDIQAIVDELEKLHVPNAAQYFERLKTASIAAIKGLATTTERDVAAQLASGIRGFDLRISYDLTDSTFKTYHGLWGATLPDIFDQIAAFFEGSRGEILYINFSHFTANIDEDEATLNAFVQLVEKRLGAWAYRPIWDPMKSSSILNDVFDQTYEQILASLGKPHSRVILVWDKDADDHPLFWPQRYCPPDDTRTEFAIYGAYTNTESVDTMIEGQEKNFRTALADPWPFALYMTLTPSPEHYGLVVADALADEVIELGALLVNPLVEALGLALKIDGALISYKTLSELSQRVDRPLEPLVAEHLLPLAPGGNRIAMIFCDYFETTAIADLAISLSNGYVREWLTSQSIEQDSGGRIDPRSEIGPGAASFDGLLHLVYPRENTGELWDATYGTESGWLTDQRIGGGTWVLRSDKGPALAPFDGKLYMVFRYQGDSDDPDNGRLAQSTFENGDWSAGVLLRDISPIDPRTDRGPSLAELDGILYLAYKGENTDAVYLATLQAGQAWQGNLPIGEIPGSTVKNGESTQRPGLGVHGGRLYLIYKDRHSNSLRQALLDGTWSGGQKIKDLPDTGIDPQSDKGPALVSLDGLFYLVYKHDDPRIYQSQIALLSWGGGESLETLSGGAIDPRTDSNPAVVKLGGGLDLFFKGDGSTELYVARLGRKRL